MNLHLVNDEKFINGAVDLFEAHYPNQNFYVVQIPRGRQTETTYVKGRDNVIFRVMTSPSTIAEILNVVKEKGIQRIFVHYLSPLKAAITLLVRRTNPDIKAYWIFYGADLYGLLHRKFNYPLYDYSIGEKESWLAKLKGKMARLIFLFRFRMREDSALESFIASLDYFCFWNPYDYQLLKKYYVTNAGFKEFIYYNILDLNIRLVEEKKLNTVLVNNSASGSGNHITILEKLKTIDPNRQIQEIIVPLSYGNANVKELVITYGNKHFGTSFNPMLSFLKIDDYYSMINRVSSAFFGSRRQEAGGNIFYLLGAGAKIFLRKENNVVRYLRENNFVVFIFEDDLTGLDDLTPLAVDQMKQNKVAYENLFNQERRDVLMKNLVSQ